MSPGPNRSAESGPEPPRRAKARRQRHLVPGSWPGRRPGTGGPSGRASARRDRIGRLGRPREPGQPPVDGPPGGGPCAGPPFALPLPTGCPTGPGRLRPEDLHLSAIPAGWGGGGAGIGWVPNRSAGARSRVHGPSTGGKGLPGWRFRTVAAARPGRGWGRMLPPSAATAGSGSSPARWLARRVGDALEAGPTVNGCRPQPGNPAARRRVPLSPSKLGCDDMDVDAVSAAGRPSSAARAYLLVLWKADV